MLLSDDDIRKLQESYITAKADYEEAVGDRRSAEDAYTRAKNALGNTEARYTEASANLAARGGAEQAVTDGDKALFGEIRAEYESDNPPEEWSSSRDFARTVRQSMSKKGRDVIDREDNAVRMYGAEIAATIREYRTVSKADEDPVRAAWGEGASSADAYLTELETLESEELDKPILEEKRALVLAVGGDAATIEGSFEDTEKEIRERLRAIDKFVGSEPFGPDGGTLHIVYEPRTDERVDEFTRLLRSVGGYATSGAVATEAELDDAIGKIERLVGCARADLGMKEPGQKADRSGAHATDARNTVKVKAVVRHADGTPASRYDYIGDKSGGEHDELKCSIAGAALLYKLNATLDEKPSYAPIIMDEAFIKSDGATATRALQRLVDMGFQPIVTVPTGPFEAVSALADRVIAVSRKGKYAPVSWQAYDDVTDLFLAEQREADAAAKDVRDDG